MSEVAPKRTVPDRAVSSPPARSRPVFRSEWARTAPVRRIREVLQITGLAPLVRSQVSLEVYGLEHLTALEGPALIVANHSSHLDTAVLLSSLPAGRRRRTAVAAAADYFFDSWPRAAGSALVFNTFPIARNGGASPLGLPGELLRDGWSLVIYPEGTRSKDGYLGRFRLGAAWLAAVHQVPVVPVGLRGTYAAMPRGRRWPQPGRPRVAVRYGRPIVPRPSDRPRDIAPKILAAVRDLVAEDVNTWWQALRADPATPTPPASTWRRVWEQTSGAGEVRRGKIWRG